MYNFAPENDNSNKRSMERLDVYDVVITGSSFDYIETYDTRASYPDLRMDSLTADVQVQPFEALKNSTFSFQLSNIGNSSATGIEVGMKIDGTLAGKVKINGTLAAGYTCKGNLTISNVPDGMHTIEVIADVDHLITELLESNNSISKSFKWTGTIDFTPDWLSNEGSIKDMNTLLYAEKDYPVYFTIKNTGNAAVNERFYVRVYGNNNTVGTFFLKCGCHIKRISYAAKLYYQHFACFAFSLASIMVAFCLSTVTIAEL